MSKTITLTEEQGDSLRYEGNTEDGLFEYVESLDWEDDGKYSLGGVIFKDKEGLFYMMPISRSGSYHTDYYFDCHLTCNQVEKREVTTLDWCDVE